MNMEPITRAATAEERLRSSNTRDGTRFHLIADGAAGRYRVATLWKWLAVFDVLADAWDAFEAMELIDGDADIVGRLVMREVRRVPRHRFGRCAGTDSRVAYLVACVQRRLAVLHPVFSGRGKSVELWEALPAPPTTSFATLRSKSTYPRRAASRLLLESSS